MKDVQNEPDARNIAIDKVGIRNIKYPISVLDKAHKIQHTVADINLYVQLPEHFRGTHMSRFVEVLNQHQREINVENIDEILESIRRALNSEAAYLELSFPYFIEKSAPVSKATSLMEYTCSMIACQQRGGQKDFVLTVRVPITTLCPCSKEISDRGAHNQRSLVTVSVRMNKLVWIEELISLIEECVVCDLYALLKREDEKHVTERAFDHPAFVEDIVRDIALSLRKDARITWFTVESENMESIHNHNAYAYVESKSLPPI
ncbi:GTP cyclohydrolase I FolE2 [candidate division FCPU426 bacterium]|nr:GTP cyclohydrolase I FolE2 [candidate division FCPU426 bacterium]